MSESAPERLTDGRDHNGRLTEKKLTDLALLAKKTMDQMANKGNAATDNYFFFNDIYCACWQAFETLEELDSARRLYIREREMVELLIAKNKQLEEELSGFRTIERQVRNGTLDETIAQTKLKMKKTEALKGI
ncbi:MAG: hypothetical protein Q8J69_07650 [Sphingobacteriaceae bacterium]|nr:hypothetical protein [Sphingobacteriaceae bacterium]